MTSHEFNDNIEPSRSDSYLSDDMSNSDDSRFDADTNRALVTFTPGSHSSVSGDEQDNFVRDTDVQHLLAPEADGLTYC